MCLQSADNNAYTEQERVRGKEFADQLSLAVLAKNWQMALKGLQEVAIAPNAMMALEMVFIRMAYASKLPTPSDLVKKLQDNPATDGNNVANNVASTPPASAPAPTGGGGNVSAGGASGGISAPTGKNTNIVHMAPRMSGNAAVQAQTETQPQTMPIGDVVEIEKTFVCDVSRHC